MNRSDIYGQAIRAFDDANQQDPNQEVVQGQAYPKEWLYAQRMTKWLEMLAPDASEALRLAVRAQHLCRWIIPRDQYPDGRLGYHQWRTKLLAFHAEQASEMGIF